MVLSNKKLKQKLRAAVVESLTASEAPKDAHLQPQTLKQLLDSATQKPRFSKREIRRKKHPSLGDSKPVEGSKDAQKENKEVGLNEKKEKKKKRKRMEGGDESTVERGDGGDRLAVEKKPEKEKKGKKKEKKKKKNKNKKAIDNGGGESKEGATDSSIIDASQENGNVATKVYVGGIPYYSTEDDIRSFFESCGSITEVDCMTFPESGKFRGIAMINFKTEAAAKRALALDGADMGGLFLKIQPYKATRSHKPSSDFSPEIVDGYNRIYVGNLSWDITEDDLGQLFSDCNISSIRFGEDKTTGEFRGYAHVDFSDSPSLTIALTLDQKLVCGRPVRIRCAVPKKETGTRLRSESFGENKKAEDGVSTGSAKKKRRTCYECGVAGHLSSSCPQKQAVKVENSGGGS
ncbi:phragmoplastin interacting protein 1 isoform X2 [Magnolia sinica]|uniref:phragmoplastin interacting protein 1 isoform X2 n=1 Tax=Magnolia sinica TaxID=86752 RepID=UPI002659A56A|nr:phragmoplastin interacting protein 1 isoform X2 [Magnolia sinica]